MKRFLGIGECMVELSPAGKDLWRQGFAGDVFNTLWYARAALSDDWIVQFHSAVGTDPVSDELVAFAEAAGISCKGIPRIENRRPGLYTIHLDGGERSFSYWRDTSAARLMLQDIQVLWDKVEAADVIYLSGITLAILPDAHVRTLLSGISEHLKPDAILGFDPNIRPKLWDDADRMRQVISQAGGIAQVVLPSFDDEQATFGDSSPDATADRYLALGAKQVVVKNGAQSTLVAEADDRQVFPVAPVENVADTTAAGDSFAGAYLAELACTGSIPMAIAAAQACSAAVVQAKGALVRFEALHLADR